MSIQCQVFKGISSIYCPQERITANVEKLSGLSAARQSLDISPAAAAEIASHLIIRVHQCTCECAPLCFATTVRDTLQVLLLSDKSVLADANHPDSEDHLCPQTNMLTGYMQHA